MRGEVLLAGVFVEEGRVEEHGWGGIEDDGSEVGEGAGAVAGLSEGAVMEVETGDYLGKKMR